MDNDDLTEDEYCDCMKRFVELENRIDEHGNLNGEQTLEKDYLQIIIEEYEEKNEN